MNNIKALVSSKIFDDRSAMMVIEVRKVGLVAILTSFATIIAALYFVPSIIHMVQHIEERVIALYFSNFNSTNFNKILLISSKYKFFLNTFILLCNI